MTPTAKALDRYRPAATALALGAIALVVCGRDLGRAPVYLYHDETIYALHAHSILTTGRDLNGLRLPLFIHTFAWVPPIAIYARVLAFMFVPVTEATTRFPGIVFYAIDVVLTYVVGRRLFRHEGLAILAGILVMLTPAHVIHARMATDHLCGVPFFIGFVLLTIDFGERRALRSLCGATACLGLGIYGYNGAITLTPVYLALIGALLFFTLEIRSLKPYLVAAAGFALSLLPLMIWLAIHPEQYGDQLRSYGVSGAASAATRNAAAALYSAVTLRLDAYYNFFDPSLLFFRGDQSMLDSTREVGVFLFPIAVLLPVGAYDILTRRRTVPDVFVLVGFLVAPIGALIVGEAKASRALVMVPLAALVAARGVEALVRSRTVVWRGVAMALLVGVVVQFHWFYRDYAGEYRERSGVWFEGDRDAALGSLIARADANHAPKMYVSSEIPLVRFSWQFYALKHGRPDLNDRMAFFDRDSDFASTPAGSVFLATAVSRESEALDRLPVLKRVAVIENVDRHPAFVVYEK